MTIPIVIVPYVRVLAAPSVEPVSLTLAKQWCLIDADDVSQDAIITLLLQATRERGEFLTGYAFVQRRLELRLDAFPTDTDIIELPYPPLVSVDYVSYLDAASVWQTLTGSPSNWIEDTGAEPGRIQPLDGASWPATQDVIAAVRIGYTCGYPLAAGSPTDYTTNIPAALKLWMNARLATYFENRQQIDLSNIAALPRDFVDGLLDNFRARKGFA